MLVKNLEIQRTILYASNFEAEMSIPASFASWKKVAAELLFKILAEFVYVHAFR